MSEKSSIILIVDDTQHNVQVLSQVTRAEGYQVIAAFNGTDAVELAKKRKPDLILLDVLMPDMNGYKVCEILKKDRELKDVPVIFLSALSDVESKIKGFSVGGVDYITKPFQREEVIARVELHLKLKKLERERERYIKELKKREKHLEQLIRAKDEVMRIVSHDIRNPLTGIIGLSDLMLSSGEQPPEMIQRMVSAIKKGGVEIMELVNDILEVDFEKNDAFSINYEDVNLEELLLKVIELHESTAISNSIKLSLNVEKELPLIPIDSQKISQVIGNLISNALKFTPQNGIVEISACMSENKPKVVSISVKDSGIGIPEENIGTLFNRHDRNRRLGLKGEKGSGMGLDIVKRYIDLHEGNIDIKSKVNEGSTFTIQLPATLE